MNKRGGNMNLIRVVAILLFCGFFSAAFARDALLGKYSGNRYAQNGGPLPTALQIVSVNGSKVKAELIRYGGRQCTCCGEAPMEGTYIEDTLKLSTAKTADIVRGCKISLTVTVTGNKLSGTIGRKKLRLELSK